MAPEVESELQAARSYLRRPLPMRVVILRASWCARSPCWVWTYLGRVNSLLNLRVRPGTTCGDSVERCLTAESDLSLSDGRRLSLVGGQRIPDAAVSAKANARLGNHPHPASARRGTVMHPYTSPCCHHGQHRHTCPIPILPALTASLNSQTRFQSLITYDNDRTIVCHNNLGRSDVSIWIHIMDRVPRAHEC